MKNLNELKEYLDYEFSSGPYTGQDYLTFQRKYINYLKDMCKDNNWQLVNVGKNHYEFTAFVKHPNNLYIYLSISDVRFFKNEWFNNILIRTAEHEKDYRGGPNQRTSLALLPFTLKIMFERM